MKNVKSIATIVLVSGVLASGTAFAGGSKPGGDPVFGETSMPAPPPAPKPILLPQPEEKSVFDRLIKSLGL